MRERGSGVFLASASVTDAEARDEGYPWSVPLLRALETIAFDAPVTFFMGENGCGKSTLLEALAVASRSVAIGASDLDADPSFAGARALARTLTVRWGTRGRPRVRLFFRAEDALGFGRRVERDAAELGALAAELDEDPERPSAARRRAAAYVRGQRRALTSDYGDDPQAASHGETFARILERRIVPNGLYFLDEPETPLSPTRVLALLVTLRAAVRAGSQFVIATHSPLLAALPGATVYVIAGAALRATPYDELEHVRVTRDFLNAPERYLRLLETDEG